MEARVLYIYVKDLELKLVNELLSEDRNSVWMKSSRVWHWAAVLLSNWLNESREDARFSCSREGLWRLERDCLFFST